MLNINEEDLKKAIVDKAADQILRHDDELSGMVRAEVQRRVEKIFAERANAEIQATIDQAVKNGFDLEYCRVDNWGRPEGEKTTIRKQLDASIQGYWTTKVDARTGKPDGSIIPVAQGVQRLLKPKARRGCLLGSIPAWYTT